MSRAITEANTLGDRSDLRTIVERVLDMPSSGRASSCELATTILDALTPALSQPSQEPVSIDPAAVDALKNHQRQLDADGVFVGVSREALDMVLASLSHPSREISIKPLSWLEGSWGRELAYGIDGKYAYEVRGPFDGHSAYWMHQGAGLTMVHVETIEAAKAAAQKDFEARIRSSLVPPEDDESRVRDLEERLAKAAEALEPFNQAALAIRTAERMNRREFQDGDTFVSGVAWKEDDKVRTITFGDFRRARTALSQTRSEK